MPYGHKKSLGQDFVITLKATSINDLII